LLAAVRIHGDEETITQFSSEGAFAQGKGRSEVLGVLKHVC
jgi:hypothetical protein